MAKLTPYIGHADDYPHTGIRKARYSKRSWFVEVWVRGRYIGLAR